MTPHQRLVDGIRRARQPVYLLTALYVAIGFVLGVYGALTGDLLAAFLGFFFINGAVGGALLFHAVSRLAVRVSTIGEGLDHVRGTLVRIEQSLADRLPLPTAPESEDEVVLDLAHVGPGDPLLLTAAKLPDDVFPRLAPTASSAAAAQQRADHALLGNGHDTPAGAPPDALRHTEVEGVDANLLRTWRIALKDGNLAACRGIFAALTAGLAVEVRERFTRELTELTECTRASLRNDFARHIRAGQFADALTVGDQLACYFADEPVAQEYAGLRAALIRRVQSAMSPSQTPMLHD